MTVEEEEEGASIKATKGMYPAIMIVLCKHSCNTIEHERSIKYQVSS